MGLSSSSGSINKHDHRLPQDKCFNVPPSEVDPIKAKTVNLDQNVLLENMNYIADTMATDNTLTEASEIVNALAAYTTGAIIEVTFFHHLNSDTYQRTWATDFSESLDNVHYSFLKIHNFQMKVVDSISFDYSQDETKATYSGEAILYPYFNPFQGDMFIYEVEPGRVGLFRIYEAPRRLSIRTGTCHSIKFILDRYVDKAILEKLNSCVDHEAYFNLERYLSNNGALLTPDEHTTYKDVKSAFDKLFHYYCDMFYDDKVYRSFISRDMLYDPYLVEFMARIIDVAKMPGYPTQLKSNPVHWKRSFWFKLLDPSQVPDEILLSKCFRVVQSVNYRTSGINALANRNYVAIDRCGIHPYPPFRIPNEYDGDVATLPMQIRLYFDKQKIKPEVLIDLTSKIIQASYRAQFYYIPVLLFLLKKTTCALLSGADILLNSGSVGSGAPCIETCTNCIFEGSTMKCPGRNQCCINQNAVVEYIPDDGGHIDDDEMPASADMLDTAFVGNRPICWTHVAGITEQRP